MESNDTMAVNAKTFRKIAKMIRRLVVHIRKEKSLPEKLAREAFDQIDDLAKEALFAKPRNCDVGTEEEQKYRFKAYCDKHYDLTKHRGCEGCPARNYIAGWGVPYCQLRWSQMPYEAKGIFTQPSNQSPSCDTSSASSHARAE